MIFCFYSDPLSCKGIHHFGSWQPFWSFCFNHAFLKWFLFWYASNLNNKFIPLHVWSQMASRSQSFMIQYLHYQTISILWQVGFQQGDPTAFWNGSWTWWISMDFQKRSSLGWRKLGEFSTAFANRKAHTMSTSEPQSLAIFLPFCLTCVFLTNQKNNNNIMSLLLGYSRFIFLTNQPTKNNQSSKVPKNCQFLFFSPTQPTPPKKNKVPNPQTPTGPNLPKLPFVFFSQQRRIWNITSLTLHRLHLAAPQCRYLWSQRWSRGLTLPVRGEGGGSLRHVFF